MRTTVTFDPDTAAAVDNLRRERGVGVSAAVNELLRRGLRRPEPAQAFTQRTSTGHARMDVSDIAAVLDVLDESAQR
jgi:hypothetical protein